MKTKNERTFKGGAKYQGLIASESAKTCAEKLGIEIQVDTYQNLDQIVFHAWNAVKKRPYLKLDKYRDYIDCQTNLNNGKATKLQFANGLQVVHIAVSNSKQTEQAGNVRYKGRVYCPQLDKHLGSDSITTFDKVCQSLYKQCINKGIL